MVVYIPTYFDLGNRGCEGIYRGIKAILGSDVKTIAYSRNINYDLNINVRADEIKSNCSPSLFNKYRYKIERHLKSSDKSRRFVDIRENGQAFLKDFVDKTGNIVLSTGGDMFCYDDNWVVYLNEYLNLKYAGSILWGCSIGEENLSSAKIEALTKFDLITPRESLTEKMLKEKLGLKNVRMYPDPAFALEAEEIELPVCFQEKEIIGINISNFVGMAVGFETLFGMNILSLIDYIIDKTDMDILLIPHVFWKSQDDRVVCKAVYMKYKNSRRLHLLNSEKLNYCQLRYIIGNCRFFIGARTHAVISAYSMKIPTLALGYSVKSIGIARDMGMPTETVVDCRNLKNKYQIQEAFKYLAVNEYKIKQTLEKYTMNCQERIFAEKRALKEFFDDNCVGKNTI